MLIAPHLSGNGPSVSVSSRRPETFDLGCARDHRVWEIEGERVCTCLFRWKNVAIVTVGGEDIWLESWESSVKKTKKAPQRAADMRAVSEATRQIVEFEELVSRLDRINDHRNSIGTNTLSSSSLSSELPQFPPSELAEEEFRQKSTTTETTADSCPIEADECYETETDARNIDRSTTRLTASNTRTTAGSSDSLRNYATDSSNPPNSRGIRQTCHRRSLTNLKSVNSRSLNQDFRYCVGENYETSRSNRQTQASPFSTNSSGASSLSSYYPSISNHSNERSSSFPTNGTNYSASYYDLKTPRSLQQHQEHPLLCGNSREKRVRVNIGIDEDLRMILEMDPSIVDRQPPTPPPMPPRRPPPPPPPLPTQSTLMTSSTSPTTSKTSLLNSNLTSSPNQNLDSRIQLDGHSGLITSTTPTTSTISITNTSQSVLVGRPPRATRPQGWYWTSRELITTI